MDIECPFCGAKKRIAFKTRPLHLILPCDQCHNLVLLYRDTVYKVDKVMLSTLLQTQNSEKILEMMDAFHRKGGRRRRAAGPRTQQKAPARRGVLAGAAKSRRPDPISRQDVIDLVIDLNTSGSVAEFLEKLE